MKPTFATPDEVSLQQFRALAAIAQTGSFTLAADALQLTQPAVSHLIKRMEQQLGQPLVVRGRRKDYQQARRTCSKTFWSCTSVLLGGHARRSARPIAGAIGKRCNTADRPASHLPEGLE